MLTALFGVMLLVLESSSAAPATPEATSAATEAPREEKKICKREDATESRLGSKRICLTAEQWRARQTTVKGLGDVSK